MQIFAQKVSPDTEVGILVPFYLQEPPLKMLETSHSRNEAPRFRSRCEAYRSLLSGRLAHKSQMTALAKKRQIGGNVKQSRAGEQPQFPLFGLSGR